VEFRILGPLEVVDGESPLPLGGPKQRALLLVLLLHAREVVSVDLLVDALWSGTPPRTAATAIQNFVSELRKLLGSDRLVTKAPGYVLLVDDEELDATRVDRLVARARAADPEKSLALLARPSRCGADRRWRTSPTKASRSPRSPGSRSFVRPSAKTGSTPRSLSEGTPRSSQSSKASSLSSPSGSGVAPS